MSRVDPLIPGEPVRRTAPATRRGRRVSPAAWAGGAVLLLLGLGAATARGPGPVPGWWPYRYDEVLPVHDAGRPSWRHPLGQDSAGHDYLALVLRGLERSLTVCLVATAVALLVGLAVGALSGYRGGWVDAVLSRVTEVVFTMPAIVIAAVLGRYTGHLAERGIPDQVVLLGVVLGGLTWMTVARVVRAQSLQLRGSGFVEASAAAGAGTWFIVTRHLAGNLLGPLLAAAALVAGNVVLLEGALSYLGFGMQAPDTSLGLLVEQYQTAFGTRPWLLLVPGSLILVIVLAVHAVGEGLAPLADPPGARHRPGKGIRT